MNRHVDESESDLFEFSSSSNNGFHNQHSFDDTESDTNTNYFQTHFEGVNQQHRHNDSYNSAINSNIMDDSTLSTFMFKDCTETVHHMHNLLLYLLSNPSEFQEAIDFQNNKSTTSTLSAFHAEYDRGTDVGSVFNGDDENIPVPFMVFASDAEVVLPQAHTASQLFGYERDSGIELEATSGMVGLSQLFLRWLGKSIIVGDIIIIIIKLY